MHLWNRSEQLTLISVLLDILSCMHSRINHRIFGLILFFLLYGIPGYTEVDSLNIWKEEAIVYMNKLQWSSLQPIIQKIKSDQSKYQEEAQACTSLYKAHMIKRSFPDSTLMLAETSLKYFLKHPGELHHTVFCYIAIGNAYSNLGDQEEAFNYYMQAINYLEDVKGPEPVLNELNLRVQYNAGFCKIKQGDLTTASSLYWDALEKAQLIKDSLFLGHIYSQIGNIYLRRKDYPAAIQVNLKGLKILEEIGAPSKLFLQGALGAAYTELNMLDSSAYYLEQVVQSRRAGKDQLSLGISLVNLAEMYRRQQNFAAAESANKEAMEMGRASNLKVLQINANINLCLCNLNQAKYDDALRYAQDGISLFSDNIEFNLAADAYLCASEASEALGTATKALDFYKKHRAYADSIINEESTSTFKALEAQYQIKENKAKIIQLENEAALKASKNKQLLLGSLAIIIILVLIGMILFINTHRKLIQSEKKQIEIEQKLLRFQMNPHFIFNAISSIQNFLFDKRELKIALKYISQFGELMRQTLEHSRESYISLDKELASLRNYLSLQQLRYQNTFEYDIIVDSSLHAEEIMIPPLIAQPFVENAIEHGQIYKVKDGKVSIRIDAFQHGIKLSIEDNGMGLSSVHVNQLKRLKKNKSLATTITKERLSVWSRQHKQKFKLLVEQIQHGGTLVTIEIPTAS